VSSLESSQPLKLIPLEKSWNRSRLICSILPAQFSSLAAGYSLVHCVPFPSSRTKSRKEKNKLASRACRLKKKAQHEANKIKLHGLEEEHNELMSNLQQVKRIVQAKWNKSNGNDSNFSQEELTSEAEKILKKTQKSRVSGQTTDYVNKMITKYS
jgi:hypothetical protein